MSTEEPQDEGEDEDIRYFVRIGGTDLDGTKSVERALTGLAGIGHRSARIIANRVGVDRHETFGRLDDEVIEDVIAAVEDHGESVPDWLVNRRKDYYTGDDVHLTGNQVEMVRQQDVNRMQKIGSYKGVRHRRGQKVRGQRTQSTGRSEGTVGVNIEEIREEAAEEELEGE